jgi:hypothetical protein
MKLNIGQKLSLAAAACSLALASYVVAGPGASGSHGSGFSSTNNPGMQGSQFGQTTAGAAGDQSSGAPFSAGNNPGVAESSAGGPGFGQGNNPGVEGSAYGRSIANDASSGRSGGQSFHSEKEEVIDTDSDSGKGKSRSEEARETNDADTTGETHVLTRISSETGVPVSTLQTQKSGTGLGNGDLETANLLAKASGQTFDSIVAKFKAGEGWGKIAHDMGLKLGKIVSDAHRSSSTNGENNETSSLIPGPGVRENSILFTGITPIPSATVSRGINPVPSATMGPRP